MGVESINLLEVVVTVGVRRKPDNPRTKMEMGRDGE